MLPIRHCTDWCKPVWGEATMSESKGVARTPFLSVILCKIKGHKQVKSALDSQSWFDVQDRLLKIRVASYTIAGSQFTHLDSRPSTSLGFKPTTCLLCPIRTPVLHWMAKIYVAWCHTAQCIIPASM